MPDYNNIAWIYDFLTKLVFGSKQDKANKVFLGEIPLEARVLVVGGGTGKIIEYLNNLGRNLEVDYVESSSKMLVLSKKRTNQSLKLNFHQLSILNYTGKDYDVIITNFFFDQFPQQLGQEIANHLSPKLKRNGFIIFSDFIEVKNLWDSFISKAAIVFLRLTANLQINCLPDYGEQFRNANLKQVNVSKTSGNIIASILIPI